MLLLLGSMSIIPLMASIGFSLSGKLSDAVLWLGIGMANGSIFFKTFA